MEEYVKWLENKIELCLEDKDLQREHWAFCQALTKFRELVLNQPCDIENLCQHLIQKWEGEYPYNSKKICQDCRKDLTDVL